MKRALGTPWEAGALARVAALLAKGCRPGAQAFVAPQWEGRFWGRWSCRVGEVVAVGPHGSFKIPVHKVPEGAKKLEQQGNPLLADSLRIAFLLTDEGLEDGRGPARRTNNLLQALSGATKLADVPAKWRKKVAATPMPVPPGQELREFQRVGVAFLFHSRMRGYVADAMGLGKTIETIVALSATRQHTVPAAVICPASVLHNWADEIRAWAPWLEPVVLENNYVPPPEHNTVYVLSWARLGRKHSPMPKRLYQAGVKCVVGDEAQAIKSGKARRSRAFRALAHRTPHAVLLSGTPLENRISELFFPLHVLDPQTYPDRAAFDAQVAETTRREVKVLDGRGRVVRRVFDGGDPDHMLDGKLQDVMLRRTKSQVLKQLPPKTRVFLQVDLPRPARMAYDRTEEEIADYLAVRQRQERLEWAARYYDHLVLRGTSETAALMEAVATAARKSFKVRADALAKLNVLRQLVGQAKVPLAVQWILDAGRQPLLVFAEHRAVAKQLAKKLARIRVVRRIDGGTPNHKRKDYVDAFQRGDIDVIVATRALATGVTLTRASRVLFVERWWLPTVEEQGEDRLHRIGQESHVQAYYLLATDTVDTHVAELVDRKRALVERVMGGEDVTIDETEADLDGEAAYALSSALAQAVARRLAAGRTTQVEAEELRLFLERRVA